MYKKTLKKLLKYAAKHQKAMPDAHLSKDWNLGEDIEIEGPDKELRMKMDNWKGGPRWHPSDNKYIKMKLREGAKVD
jgi:hypothetical protein